MSCFFIGRKYNKKLYNITRDEIKNDIWKNQSDIAKKDIS